MVEHWVMLLDQLGFNTFMYIGEFNVGLEQEVEVAEAEEERLERKIDELNADLPFGETLVTMSSFDMERLKFAVNKELNKEKWYVKIWNRLS